VRRDKLVMLDHRVAGEADFAGDLQPFGARRHAGEADAALHHVALDAIQPPEEIEVPPRAAEFAVGDRPEADVFLLADDAFDLAVFDRRQIGRRHLAPGALRARLAQRHGPQQASDVIGPERRLVTLH